MKRLYECMRPYLDSAKRIRETSLREQFAVRPSTNNVLEASGGRDISGLREISGLPVPYTTFRRSTLPTFIMCGSSAG